MKKTVSFISIFLIIFIFIACSGLSVNAKENTMIFDTSPIYESLSDEVKESLSELGLDITQPQSVDNLTFNSILSHIAKIASENVSSPLKGLVSLIAIMLLASLLTVYKETLSGDISSVLNVVSNLCVTCAVVTPAVAVINLTCEVISSASNFMLSYVPVMVMIMSASGQIVAGSSYYALMIAAGEVIGQISSNIITPLLQMFLGLSVTGSISPDINLRGFTKLISKTIKWILTFAMTIFTALLSFKQLIATSADTVSGKAIKFSINSFIPIVGSALSDAYKTVQSSMNLLKSGVGIFVIVSIAIIFLPVILQTVMWIFSLWISKATAEVLGLSQVNKLLESLSEVFSSMLAIMLCILTVYIISTAVVLTMGGGIN